ncbi:twin-arginine translocase subunit TatC [Pajaroellobacter abortibovis]|uniref:Sec-independent protein translocase protein TatC n=1 Tax=Pajaroellobacter abortibovis TaxID=1882918 RepID=A0A1L6MWX9_9BACT|nr:twin-arginine translocase subunit TatC [Pajaroellobacter abortibovis]APR99964.1 twin arginine-targeting protein translocase TatC [Pajaroellobacter abortibovis]
MSADLFSSLRKSQNDARMTFFEHLEELRVRLLRAVGALTGCTLVGWVYRVEILGLLLIPYENAWREKQIPGAPELQTLSPADAFVGYLQLSLFAGLIGAAPFFFYELWGFISPGLYPREKRLIIPFVFFSTLLFLAGVLFVYHIAFPFTFNYFLSLLGQVSEGGTVLTHRPTLEFYLDFAMRMILAFGLVFELPLFIAFLVIGGLVTPKQLLKFSRWAILLSFFVGAVVTPGPEVSSQVAVSSVLVALYFLSIGIAFLIRPSPSSFNEPA